MTMAPKLLISKFLRTDTYTNPKDGLVYARKSEELLLKLCRRLSNRIIRNYWTMKLLLDMHILPRSLRDMSQVFEDCSNDF